VARSGDRPQPPRIIERIHAPTSRITIYYGAADTVTCLAFAQADELVDFVKVNSEI